MGRIILHFLVLLQVARPFAYSFGAQHQASAVPFGHAQHQAYAVRFAHAQQE